MPNIENKNIEEPNHLFSLRLQNKDIDWNHLKDQFVRNRGESAIHNLIFDERARGAYSEAYS